MVLIALTVVLLFAAVVGRYFYKLFTCTSIFPANIPSERKIDSYGHDKFVKQVLEYKVTQIINNEISQAFNPKRVENYNVGVLLVFAENKKYRYCPYFR